MKGKRILMVLSLLGLLVSVTGCPTNGGGLTGPADAPQLLQVTTSANPTVHAGELLIFYINFVDASGDVNGGSAVITDTQNGVRYDSFAYGEGTSGILTISIQLYPGLIGEVMFSIFVFDQAGNQSNVVYATVTIV